MTSRTWILPVLFATSCDSLKLRSFVAKDRLVIRSRRGRGAVASRTSRDRTPRLEGEDT